MSMTEHKTAQTAMPAPDLREIGASREGEPQSSDRRLFVQLHVFGACEDVSAITEVVKQSGLESAVYLDVNDPKGVGVLVLAENPETFIRESRCLLHAPVFKPLVRKPELTMFGRTYATGREADLEDWLLKKPKRNALNPKWPWAVWYPLRRKPEFELLSKQEQGRILGEHALMGMAYGRAGYASDIRLACHGLDQNDNEFVIGLVGPDLYPLSRLVQDMRKSQQTAKYIQSLGPFFVGKVYWQSPFRET